MTIMKISPIKLAGSFLSALACVDFKGRLPVAACTLLVLLAGPVSAEEEPVVKLEILSPTDVSGTI